MEATKSLSALLNKTTPVILVANENIEGSPLVTPLMDSVTNLPKTDMMGKALGSIRVQQETTSLANGSFLNVRKRVAFISGSVELLTAIISGNGLKAGSALPGKIVITESLEPFWNGQNHKINPQTDEPIGVTINDKFYPVYMRMLYQEDGSGKDVFIRTPEEAVNWFASRTALTAQTAGTVETASMPQA